LKHIERKGFRHGENLHLGKDANIDTPFCHLISCGDNVTITKGVYILAHDASMKKLIGKTKVSPVSIGNNVFIGAHSVVLPGVSIGDWVIIAANSCVSKSIPSGEVWGGSPARYIMKVEEFEKKHRKATDDKNDRFWYVE